MDDRTRHTPLSPAAEPERIPVQPPPIPPRPSFVGSLSIASYLKNINITKTANVATKRTELQEIEAASNHEVRRQEGREHENLSDVANSQNALKKANPQFNPAEDVFDNFTLARNVRLDAQISVSEKTRRNCKMTSVYFLDFYFDLITYLDQRKFRTEELQKELETRNVCRHLFPKIILAYQLLKYQANESETESVLAQFYAKERANLRCRRTRLRLSSFQILLQIGQGGYGQVFLVRKRDAAQLGCHEFMALKKMSKRALKKMGEIHHVLTERDILARADSPWLVKLFFAFQDLENVYFAMEYVPGGDVRTLFNNSGVLREEHARFYIAEMATAVSELHRLGFVHRDLKPENFLIDAFGHIKLTDFIVQGLSRGTLSEELVSSLRSKLEKVKETPYTYRSIADRRNLYKSVRRNDMMRCFSQVGSPDYMAPEVLKKCHSSQNGYTLAVDWWSLGCILFEALCGYTPFSGTTTDEIWVNVYHWQRVLERPVYAGDDEEFNLSDTAWDLVTSLIATPKKRITSLAALQSHQFFINYPFTALRTSATTPPFVPTLSSPTDTSYFDDFSNPKDMAMYKEVKERQAKLEERIGAQEKGGNAVSGFLKRLSNSGRVLAVGASREEDAIRLKLRQDFVGFTFKRKD